jgi:hypothetical protein
LVLRAPEPSSCEARVDRPEARSAAEFPGITERALEVNSATGENADSDAVYTVDVDNDGRNELVFDRVAGSLHNDFVAVFRSTPQGLQNVPIPPPWGDEECCSAASREGLIVRLCGKTYVAFRGFGGDAIDARVWQDGKLSPACDAHWARHQLAHARTVYDRGQIDSARIELEAFLTTCRAALEPELRLRLLHDLAVLAYRLGDTPVCLSYTTEAKALPVFPTSPARAAIVAREASCEKGAPLPAVDLSWLLEGPLKTGYELTSDPRFEVLLDRTVPVADARTIAITPALADRLPAGEGEPVLAPTIRRWVSMCGVDDVVRDGRRVTLTGYMRGSWGNKALIWVDVDTGRSIFAASGWLPGMKSRPDDVVGSKTVGPADVPAAFWSALDRWQEGPPSRPQLYLDGRGKKVVATLVERK